jgi:hypothetical protein
MTKREEMLAEVLAAPRDFLHGFLGGLFGPLLALAWVIGLVYALTGQLPAIKEVRKENGDRQRAIVLASQAEARASWARSTGDLRGAMLEIKTRTGPRPAAGSDS